MVGKTTLCQALVKYLNAHGWPHVYRHLSRLPACWSYDTVGNYQRLMSPYIVQDRFHMSEPPYAMIRHESAMLGPTGYAQVDKLLTGFESYIILITADEELIKSRWRDGEMYDIERVLTVNRLYGEIAEADGGGWCGYRMRYDLWLHCTEEAPFPVIDENMNLHIYMNRLTRSFMYPGSRRTA